MTMKKNTTHEDKFHHLPAMAYKMIIECKHSYAINPSQNSVLQAQHEANLASQYELSLIHQLRRRQFHARTCNFDIICQLTTNQTRVVTANPHTSCGEKYLAHSIRM